MNTDNMAISGETIDYGPCAFMNTYDPETVFSSIDQHGRYAYFNQPGITKWNLARFAEALIPLINKKKDKAIQVATDTINNFGKIYKKKWLEMMRKKIGLIEEKAEDEKLINDLLSLMHKNKADYTNTFCSLIDENAQKDEMFNNKEFIDWYKKWKKRLIENNSSHEQSKKLMNSFNPQIIPRNHKVEEVLEAAHRDDLKPLNDFLKILKNPYEKQPNTKNYQSPPPPSKKKYKTFCGT
jgi:uncharacterized protein YdiU (UPF0061 family)